MLFLLHPQNDVGVTPQLFQVVKGAFVGAKEMDDYITIVHQDPPTFGIPLYSPGERSCFFLGIFSNAIGQRLKLPAAFASTDQEKVCKEGFVANIKQNDISTFFIQNCVYQ